MALRCDNSNCETCHPALPERACDRCATALAFVSDDARYEQYSGALHLSLYGGYGEYIDLHPLSWAPRAVLCGRCVDELRAGEPWLERILADYFATS